MHYKCPCGNEVLTSACIVRVKLLSKMLFKIDFKVFHINSYFSLILYKIYIIEKYKYDFKKIYFKKLNQKMSTKSSTNLFVWWFPKLETLMALRDLYHSWQTL